MTPKEAVAYVEERLAKQDGLNIIKVRLDGNAEAGNLALQLETRLYSVVCGQGNDIDRMEIDCLMEAAADTLSAAVEALRGEG